MPGFDRTGPNGQGAGTGRGLGGCLTQSQPGLGRGGRGMGQGMGRRMGGRGMGNFGGRGMRRGLGNGFGPAMPVEIATETDERIELQNQIDSLKMQLSEIKDLLMNKNVSETSVEVKPEPQK
ncbi:MAG: DUF5320 family protein [Candidatus Riflebacteria bacterium]|nr:DUF5320 family protein [Candidatus Riflebacteria bacterium]